MLLVLQIVQLVGVIRTSFQVQRMELLVFVPEFPFQDGSQRVFAVPKFSSEDKVLHRAMERCTKLQFSWSVEVAAAVVREQILKILVVVALVPCSCRFSLLTMVPLVERVVVIRFICVCFVPCVKLEGWKEDVYLLSKLDDQRRAGGRKR